MCVYNLVVLCITWAPASWTLCFSDDPPIVFQLYCYILYSYFWQNKVTMMMMTSGMLSVWPEDLSVILGSLSAEIHSTSLNTAAHQDPSAPEHSTMSDKVHISYSNWVMSCWLNQGDKYSIETSPIDTGVETIATDRSGLMPN